MEFKQVECFVAVARKKSFSRAADILFVSQPAITISIQKLEKELGIALFDRKRKEVVLTEGGKIFYRYAAEIINIYDNAKHSISEYKNNIEGLLEICSSTIPEQYLLPYIVKAFKEIYPLVRFSISHKDSKEVVEEIVSGRINLGFVGAKYSNIKLQYIDFYNDRLVLITNPDKIVTDDPISINSFIGEDIVLREEGSGTRLLIEKAMKEKQLDMSIFHSQIINDSLEAIKKMVSLGVGISFVSEIAVISEVASGRLKQYAIEDLDLKRQFSLVYCSGRALSPVEEKFKEFVDSWKWDSVAL